MRRLIALLPALYPSVWKTCPLQRFEGRGLLFHWKGKTDGDPAVLMAHYDVVPVEEDNWQKPAFDAIIEDGVLWGRGTLDTKATFNGILTGAENLIRQGFLIGINELKMQIARVKASVLFENILCENTGNEAYEKIQYCRV